MAACQNDNVYCVNDAQQASRIALSGFHLRPDLVCDLAECLLWCLLAVDDILPGRREQRIQLGPEWTLVLSWGLVGYTGKQRAEILVREVLILRVQARILHGRNERREQG